MAQSRFQSVWHIVCLILAVAVVVATFTAVALSPDLSESLTDYVASFLPDKNVKIERAIPYVSQSDRQRLGDLYFPLTASDPHPAVVMVHGGSWVKGDRGDIGEVGTARYLASKGFVAFVIDYRLAGAGGEFPNDVLDTRLALNYLLSNKERWKIDPKQLYVAGSSSGATTAMLAGYLPDELFAGQSTFKRKDIRAVISFSGPTDLVKLSSNPYLKSYIQTYSQASRNGGSDAGLADASPIHHSKTALPTVFIHGTADKNVPITQSLAMASALKSNGILFKFITIEGADHFLGLKSRKLALEQALQFLARLPNRASNAGQ